MHGFSLTIHAISLPSLDKAEKEGRNKTTRCWCRRYRETEVCRTQRLWCGAKILNRHRGRWLGLVRVTLFVKAYQAAHTHHRKKKLLGCCLHVIWSNHRRNKVQPVSSKRPPRVARRTISEHQILAACVCTVRSGNSLLEDGVIRVGPWRMTRYGGSC
ncbi:hypothetical protein GGTG_12796 [Gaeumannomyces tritici R3-111a-1]|uniref:Uncharacterized protein n=1 Tax=Gaeumannomyces tritici (strain R3-111a-1) TaxID=644352 RepID=J3PH16_GAET3|nr:hypothetical protein GGTG_12796 [Gaeumannomyces tritici R3-111a-1]EJT69913.1 hypothetical protein GGTG_12796 [Gaeumannomyces tritici R3-111a-1]